MYLPTRLPETETRDQSPFTLDALIAWLRTKNPEETYCYGDNGGCLLAQYFSEQLGIADVRVGGSYWRDASLPRHENPLPARFGGIAVQHPWTFGAALSRATAIRGV